jgi:hypothetical protein
VQTDQPSNFGHVRRGKEVRSPAWLTMDSNHFLARGTACVQKVSPSSGYTLEKRVPALQKTGLWTGRNDRDEGLPRPMPPTVKKGVA